MKPMDHAEVVTKAILEAAIPGAAVTFRNQQAHMEYDFELRYPCGTVAAVEATSSRDQVLTETSARIFNKKRGGSHVSAILCKKSWLIFVSGNEIQRVRESADKYLARLEAEGIEAFSFLDAIRDYPKCIADICADLRLTNGAVFSSQPPPVIIISSDASGFAVGVTSATDACSKEILANKEKLGKAETAERHLVVYVDRMNAAPRVALTSFEPPPSFPDLPEEITHVWLATEYEKREQFVVWYGSRVEQWRRMILAVGGILSTTEDHKLPPSQQN